MTSIQIRADHTNSVGYIRLSNNPVDHTVEHDDCVLVDLDVMGVAVGIELLDLDARIPFSDLVKKYHVSSNVVALLRRIQPSVNAFVMNANTSQATPASVPESQAANQVFETV